MSWPVVRPEDCLPDVDGLEVAVDTETSGKHPDDGARVAVVSVAFDRPDDDEPWCWAFPFDQGNREGKPEWQGQDSLWVDDDPNLDVDAWVHLMRWLRRQRLTMHPILFDCPMLRAGTRLADYTGNRHWTGPDLIEQCVYDTQVGNKEIYPLFPQGLKETSVRLELLRGTRYVDEVMGGWEPGIEARDQAINRAHLEKIKVRGGGGSAYSTGRWDLGDWSVIGPYAALDALETHLLRERQKADIEAGQDGSLGPAAYHAGRWLPRENRKTKVLYQMMRRGLEFDTGRCLDAAGQVTKARDTVAKGLPFPPTIEKARDYWFSPAGPMKLIPYDMTTPPPGSRVKPKPKLDAEIVGKMVTAQVPHAVEFQTWQKLDTALSKWYLAYPSMTGSDGRLRTVFKQTQVRSGRTSVERVNSQAFPSDYQVKERLPAGTATPKECVTAKPGHKLWGLDLAQAELRVAARWAPCPSMLDLIRTGADTHGVTATELFGVHPGDPDWTMYRQVAKRSNFSLIFGVGPATFQKTLSKFLGLIWDIDRVTDVVSRWKRLYPEFEWAISRAARSAKHNQHVRLKNGRLSWFDTIDFRSDPDAHKAFNRFVQASLAEMGAEWMIWIEDQHPGLLVNWVHDAAYLEVPVDEEWRVEEISAHGAKLFEQMFDVPGGVDAHLEATGAAA
jgi:hypothetical protein